ncbi:hypothetical protein ACFVFI_03925 [Streptomyces sp. NPDC057705]|uniref:hypothetical protein n=1 Tax=Streptomyces sp. NPDC057705 TaxID=3346222 RepID=UPI0036918842
MLARATRLEPGAREVLDALARLGTRAAPWLVEAVSGRAAADLDACLDRGLVAAEGGAVVFRRELVRVAVMEAIPPGHAAAALLSHHQTGDRIVEQVRGDMEPIRESAAGQDVECAVVEPSPVPCGGLGRRPRRGLTGFGNPARSRRRATHVERVDRLP